MLAILKARDTKVGLLVSVYQAQMKFYLFHLIYCRKLVKRLFNIKKKLYFLNNLNQKNQEKEI